MRAATKTLAGSVLALLVMGGVVFILLLSQDEYDDNDVSTDVPTIILRANDTSLAQAEGRARFMNQLRSAAGKKAEPILKVLKSDSGNPRARILALQVAAMDATEEDLAAMCELYEVVESRAEKIGVLQALTLYSDPALPKLGPFRNAELPGPSLITDMGPVRNARVARHLMSVLENETSVAVQGPLFEVLGASQAGLPEITDFFIRYVEAEKHNHTQALFALGAGTSEKATRALTAWAREKPEYADVFVPVLATQDTVASISAALRLLEGMDSSKRIALYSLARTQNSQMATKVDGFLIDLLTNHPDPLVRAAAAKSIWLRKPSVAEAALTSALKTETDEKTKAEIRDSLKRVRERKKD